MTTGFEHNSGSDHVTWRDLENLIRDRVTAELDRRFKEHGNQHMSDKGHDQEALRLARETLQQATQTAREQVLKHDEEKNNLLAQMARERADFSTKREVNDQLEKLHSEVSAEVLVARNEIRELRVSQASAGQDVRTLQTASTYTKGKEAGLIGIGATVGGVLATIAYTLLK